MDLPGAPRREKDLASLIDAWSRESPEGRTVPCRLLRVSSPSRRAASAPHQPKDEGIEASLAVALFEVAELVGVIDAAETFDL